MARTQDVLANPDRPRIRGQGGTAVLPGAVGTRPANPCGLAERRAARRLPREDIDPYRDAQIGAAVRDIHRGCRKSLHDYLTIEPIISAAEEEQVQVPTDFDPAAIRLIGNVDGKPPFRGTLKHHGWRVRAVHLPTLPATRDDTSVLSPAEVEIPEL